MDDQLDKIQAAFQSDSLDDRFEFIQQYYEEYLVGYVPELMLQIREDFNFLGDSTWAIDRAQEESET